MTNDKEAAREREDIVKILGDIMAHYSSAEGEKLSQYIGKLEMEIEELKEMHRLGSIGI